MDEMRQTDVQTTVKRNIPNYVLKRERELRGWSQSALGEKIGAQANLVNRWETGSAFPSPYYREKLCTLFEKNAEELQLIKRTSGVPIVSEESLPPDLPDAPGEVSLPQPRLSRRSILFGTGGVAVAGIGIGSIAWWVSSHSTSRSMPQKLPTMTTQYVYRTATDVDVNEVFWSPFGTFIACVNGDKTIQILNAATGELTLTYREHTGYVDYASWSPDQTRIASASGDKTVRIWNPMTGKSLLTYTNHTAAVLCVAWSLDGSLIASSDDSGQVQVWDAFSGKIITHYGRHTKAVKSLSWSKDNSMASAGSDGTIQVWNPLTGIASSEFRYHGSQDVTVYEVTWSPDGRRLVAAQADSVVVIWDGITGGHILSYTGHTDQVYSARWSPRDGRYIASAGVDKTIQIWNDKTGERLLTYTGHTDQVYEVAWSPDGKHLASGSRDHSMYVSQVTLP